MKPYKNQNFGPAEILNMIIIIPKIKVIKN
jgi:hypothetical protein